MLVIFVIITFVLVFMAGMHYALWDNFDERKSLYFSIALGVLGVWNFISLIGYVSKLH